MKLILFLPAEMQTGPYTEDSFVLTIDGFIVSSNIDVLEANVLDTGFKYSDHNPVYMDFVLK